MYDDGFNLPDIRDTYYCKDGEKVTVTIIRNWYHPDNDYDDDVTFKPSFNIQHGKDCPVSLPIGIREEQAEIIARTMYQEDIEETRILHAMLAEERAERRMGC